MVRVIVWGRKEVIMQLEGAEIISLVREIE